MSASRVRNASKLIVAPGLSIAMLLVLIQAADGQQGKTTWDQYGGSADNSHYLDLKQINKSNVTQLQQAWFYPTHDDLPYVFNPIVVRGVMYLLAHGNSLVAIDAATGREKWIHADLNGIAGRGILYWESKDGKDQRLIFTIHEQLQEIDAETGKSILTFGHQGYVDLRAGLGRSADEIHRIQSGTPGRVFENLVILGSATGEGYLSPPGDVRAYNVMTGDLAWQFHTIPHPGEYGYDTWPKDAWKYIGGVNDWGEFSLDERRGIVYLVLGSPTYDYYGVDRTGNDFFSDSIVALDARTGKYLWHFQEVHHDLWDYDPCSAPQLLTINHQGKKIDVVAQAGKTGYLYVLDRETGKPIWPIEEHHVPASTMAGEHSSPTQPIPSAPPPFVRLKFTANDVDSYLLTTEEQAKVRSIIAATPAEQMFFPPTTHDTIEMPGSRGGSNWGTTSANPSSGMMYVSSVDAPAVLHLFTEEPEELGFGIKREGTPGGIIYQKNCQACHGANRQGSMGPALVDVGNRLGIDAIRSMIVNGKGQMPGFSTLSNSEVDNLMAYLADPTGSGGTKFARSRMADANTAEVPSSELVVGSGGAPAGKEDPGRKIAPIGAYGIMGGPPYPADVHAPGERYFSAWNVMYKYINPPWSSLTAYDLNTGTIKWRVPIGEEATAVKLGAHDTGALTEQRAPIVTSTGLIFLASSDGKLRAYDDQTGKTLWTRQMPGGNKAIPTMYELNGRQYIVVDATAPLEDGSPGADREKAVRGYVAYALP